MFKGARRGGPAGSVQGPVASHSVGAACHVDRDELLQFVADFVAEKEASLTAGAEADASLGGALALLKRLEREWKGLPRAEST